MEHLDLTLDPFAANVCVTCSTVTRRENGRGKPLPFALQQMGDLISEMGAEGTVFLKEIFPEGN